jgi:hypothetical protein
LFCKGKAKKKEQKGFSHWPLPPYFGWVASPRQGKDVSLVGQHRRNYTKKRHNDKTRRKTRRKTRLIKTGKKAVMQLCVINFEPIKRLILNQNPQNQKPPLQPCSIEACRTNQVFGRDPV